MIKFDTNCWLLRSVLQRKIHLSKFRVTSVFEALRSTKISYSFSIEQILHCSLNGVSYFGISLYHQKVSDLVTSPVGRDLVVVVV